MPGGRISLHFKDALPDGRDFVVQMTGGKALVLIDVMHEAIQLAASGGPC